MQIFGTNVVGQILATPSSTNPNTFEIWDSQPMPKVMEFKDDPVALSVAAWRQRFSDPYPDFDSVVADAADRQMANVIRAHFVSKITMQKLKSDRISQFRDKLGAFLVGNRPLYKEELGMLYHLPYFYREDLEIDELTKQIKSADADHRDTVDVIIRPIKTIEIRRRSGVATQFWWVDDQNRPYCVTVNHNNEHSTLIRSLWQFAKISVQARLHRHTSFGANHFYYYKISNMQLLTIVQ